MFGGRIVCHLRGLRNKWLRVGEVFGTLRNLIGVVMEYKIVGRIGEMEVDLVVSAPTVERKKAGGSVPAVSDEEMEEVIDGLRDQFGNLLAHQADAMVSLMAEQNKSGRVAIGRAYREVWMPLVQELGRGRLTADELAVGMEAALAKGIANVNYAKKAALKEDVVPVKVAAESKYRVV